MLEKLIQETGLLVVGAEYSLETGVVDFFENVPESPQQGQFGTVGLTSRGPPGTFTQLTARDVGVESPAEAGSMNYRVLIVPARSL